MPRFWQLESRRHTTQVFRGLLSLFLCLLFFSRFTLQRQSREALVVEASQPAAAVTRGRVIAAGTNLCTAEVDHTLNSGENTYDGLDIDINGCTFVINGAHAFNSVNVISGGVLTHSGPSTSTVTKMTLTVTNTFTVDGTSQVNVNGKGFLGGAAAGWTTDGLGGGAQSNPQGIGMAAAHGGRGSGWNGAATTDVYDSVTNPVEPGGGGGEWFGTGGDGGGAVIISAGAIVIDGSVLANGVNGSGRQGAAGGTINLQATGTISGSGSLAASGSNGNGNYGGGGGRIALVGSSVTFPVANITNSPGLTSAGPGSIFVKQTSDVSHPNGVLYVKGTTSVYATPISGAANYDSITVSGSGKMTLIGASTISDTILLDNGGLELDTDGSSVVSAGTVTLQNGAILTHYPTGTTHPERLRLSVSGVFSLSSNSFIDVSGRGFQGGGPSCAGGWTIVSGVMQQVISSGCNGGGAPHGGRGTTWNGSVNNDAYDSLTNPIEPGSGAGEWFGSGGYGGGSIIITAASAVIDGTVTLNGTNGTGRNGGAGGTFNLQTTGALSGTGTITGNGANGNGNYGGGGGRVALIGNTVTFPVASVTLAPGLTNAGPGTLYVKQTSDLSHPNGVLYVKGTTGVYATPVPGSYNFDSMTISGGGKINLQGASTISDTVLLDNGGIQFETTGNTAVSAGTFTMQNSSIMTHAGPSTSTVTKINLTVVGVFSLDATSQVNLNGLGFYGGNAAGWTSNGSGGGVQNNPQGIGMGAAHGGRGSGWNGASTTDAYDSVNNPTEPGGGGGEWFGNGGNGGGALILNAATITINGTINANGVDGPGRQGAAGGTINLQASGAITGSGTITTNGSTGNGNYGGGGGRVALVGNTVTFPVSNITNTPGLTNAGPGTIFIKQASDLSHPNGTLYVKGTASLYATPISGLYNFDIINISSGGKITLQGVSTISDNITLDNGGLELDTTGTSVVTVGSVVLQNSSVLTHYPTSTSQIERLRLSVTGAFSLDATSSVNVSGRGMLGTCSGNGYTTDFNGGLSLSTVAGIGPSHGGRGYNWDGNSARDAYDSTCSPTEPGAGAAEWFGCGGVGGGSIVISAGSMSLNGTISANGVNGAGWIGGAGGTVSLQSTAALSGSPTISAVGTSGNNGVGGGGGRIALIAGSYTATPTFQIYGGANAASGTVCTKDTSVSSLPNLLVDNNNANVAAETPYFVAGQPTTVTVRDVTVRNYGKLRLASPGTAFTVNGATTLLTNGQILNSLGGGFSQAVLNIVTTSLPSGVVGISYNQTLIAGGGYGPYAWTCRNGGLTVACNTVLPLGLTMSGGGVISGTPTTSGVYTFTVRATEASPGINTDDQILSITVGNAPSAPTTLFTSSSDAQSGFANPTGIDATPVFSAIYNDADAGDAASKYRIQVASDAGFSSIVWDSGAAGTSMTSCAVAARCQNITFGGSPLALTGATYYWRIKFWDSSDIEGAFSAGTDTFITDVAPTAPTLLYSNDGSAQAGLINPIGILNGRPNFSAIYNDPDTGDIATKYRIQVSTTNNFSALVWDSGALGTSMSSCNKGARCADIVYGATNPLAFNQVQYFWRIKFFDAAGVESPWSEDPIATNKFTMGQESGNVQIQIQQQNSAPSAPGMGGVQVVNSSTLRYTWIDNSSNETGFRLLDENGAIIAEVGPGITMADETGLTANTLVSGRTVVAFNNNGVSAPSGVFPSAVTSMPAAQPLLVRRGVNSVTFNITPAPGNLNAGNTGVMYELIVHSADPRQTPRILTSDWRQSGEYTFTGISETDKIEVRVLARNQVGYASDPSPYVMIEQTAHDFTVNLNVVKKGTAQLPKPLSPDAIISVSAQIKNTGSASATTVLASMILPKYVKHLPGTLTVDGRTATDFADEDPGQTTERDISVVWAAMTPGDSHTIAFDLFFDSQALRDLKTQLQASANPLIDLVMTVGFAESDQLFASPAVTLEPDLALITDQPTIEEQQITKEEPVAPPTHQDVEQLNNLINELLQQEVSLNQSAVPSQSQPGGPQTQTNVSSDGATFNVDVSRSDGAILSVSGQATPNQGQIEFTGTTSQPNSVVTLIFNGSVTVIVVSDAEGSWHTFVSADQLGIKSGETANVSIEAIAAKGDLRSDKVNVGHVTIALLDTGDVATKFETTVSAIPGFTVVNEVRKEVARAIVRQEPAIQRTLATTAPVIVVSSVPLWGYLPYLPTMIYHAITYLVGFVGRKHKNRKRFYGVIYDSISKQPLALAIIRIYNKETNKLVGTQVSDKLGRYEALLEPATYRLEVTKPTYTFPSHIVTQDVDGAFQHVYHNEQGMPVQADDITVPDVPLDPINTQRQWQVSHGFKKIWLALQNVGNYLAAPVLIVGAVASVAVVATIPENPLNWLLAGSYVVMLAAQLKLRPHIEKAWGVVYDLATNAALPLTTIQLIDPQYGKVVTSRLTDYQGRYSFLPEPGHYVLRANKPGFEQIKEVIEAPDKTHHPISEQVDINKPDERITGDVPMKQTS